MSYSFKTGCLQAALLCVAFIMGSLVIALARPGTDAEALGQAAGRMLFLVGGLGLLISAAWQRGHKALAGIMALVVAVAFPVWALTRGVGAGLPRMSADDRAGLGVGVDSIRHARLGFVLPHPGDAFEEADMLPNDMRAEVEDGPIAMWFFRTLDSSAVVLVQATKGLGSESQLRDFVRGQRQQAQGSEATILTDTITWTGNQRESRLDTRMSNGAYTRWRCVSSAPETLSRIVCVATITGEPDDLAFVRQGLALTTPTP